MGETALIDELGGLVLWKPLAVTLGRLTPGAHLRCHTQWEDLNKHEALTAVRKALGIGVDADRLLRHDTRHASFLSSFDGGNLGAASCPAWASPWG